MLSALIGGVLIGLAATWFWFANGRIAGVSGILRGALLDAGQPRGDRVAFLGGLLTAGVLAGLLRRAPASVGDQPLGVLMVAGALVGLGTRIGGGCTSGHGVCGVSRFSARSLAATLTFMVVGIATVFLVSRLAPGWLPGRLGSGATR